ncbi:putative transmembrane protein [Rhodopirellula islandica]|uniref:Transmembrane protein n=1 Tax=Rhodopirellula islandica TaxID=595434 RepID=A0A0J1B3R3_RHOIS|nr:secreted protein containing EF hand domain protein [Rhodopirellula islandica]KLU01387.1 putative transmembrane protein [Rhodopirellula islandica]
MKTETESLVQSAEEHPQRRRFLLKLLAGSTALPLISSVAFAQKPNRLDKDGERDPQARRRAGAGLQLNPTKIAAKLIKDHDKDGDGALNEKELAAALTAFREGRTQGMRGRQGEGRERMRPGADGQRAMRNQDKGVQPKRPGE